MSVYLYRVLAKEYNNNFKKINFTSLKVTNNRITVNLDIFNDYRKNTILILLLLLSAVL